jgi:hypothetical protein
MLIPLKLPPGVYRNGTRYQSQGRWYDASLVRFVEGSIRPWGGWQAITEVTPADVTTDPDTVAPIQADGVPRTLLGWRDNTGVLNLAIGTNTHLHVIQEGKIYDITPEDLTTGSADASNEVGGYGNGPFGFYNYGNSDSLQSTPIPPAVWQLDTFGQFLVGTTYPNDGRLFVWENGVMEPATVVDASAPTECVGLVVTPERFLFALGARGIPRNVEWPNQESLTQWDAASPAEGSAAGDFILEGNGNIVTGRRLKGETLIWTDDDVHTARYIGGTLIYSFEKLGSKCGLISPGGVALVESQAVWMSQGQFFLYDGYVKPLPCEISDHIFSDINLAQKGKITTMTFAQFGEVVWFYPSANSSENDRYAVWNWREGHWNIGRLSRTAGADRGALQYPTAAIASGYLFEHERGTDMLISPADDTEEPAPFLESGPSELGNGDRFMYLTRIVPDEKTQGDVKAYFYTSNYPSDPNAETLHGPFTLGKPTNLRLTARMMRVRLEQNVAANWRVGIMRFDAQESQRR